MMNIEITARGFTVNQNLNNFIHEKLQKLTNFDKSISNVRLVLLKESRAEKVELIVKSNKNIYISKSYSSLFEKTIVKAINNIITQIKKVK